MADDVDPASRLERLDDLRRNAYAANVFDVAARNRLAIRDDGERLHDCARIARRLFRVQALDERLHLGAGLKAPAARELDQLDGTAAPVVAQLGEQPAHLVDADLALEAARLGLELRLPLADSVILATARLHNATIWTQDEDFEGMDGVRYLPSRNR